MYALGFEFHLVLDGGASYSTERNPQRSSYCNDTGGGNKYFHLPYRLDIVTEPMVYVAQLARLVVPRIE